MIAAPGLTVAAVARRLGVAPSTLRTWDRRYGLGPTAHAAGTHRRYTPEDLHRLTAMRRLTLEGVPPAEAAHFVMTDQRPLATVTPRREEPDHSPGQHSPGGGRVLGMPDGARRTRGLARAAMALDVPEMTRLLRASVDDLGVTRTWEELAAPVLIAVGERWQRFGESVEVEHALSEALLGVLRIPDPSPGDPAPHARPTQLPRPSGVVLLACSEGDLHTLPLYVLAAALADQGVPSRMLGGGMPAKDLVAAVRRSGPAVVFLFASLTVRDCSVLVELPRQRPAPCVVVGGQGWSDVVLPAGVRRVASLTDAVVEVCSAVQL